MNNKRMFGWLAIGWTVIIFIGCAWPGNGLPSEDNIDKFEHAGIFMLYALLWLKAGKSIRWVLLSGAIYGMGIELFQGIMPIGRSFDWFDALADVVGAVLGVAVYAVFSKFERRRV